MKFKTIIATVVAASIVSTSAMACAPRYTSNVGSIMAQVRVSASKAGTAAGDSVASGK